jgi:hypothetical protein
MTIKHLQLNTSLLQDPIEIMRFISDNAIEVACLQEIHHPLTEPSPLEGLCQEVGYSYAEGVHFISETRKSKLAVALVSRFPFIDTIRLYYNADDYRPKVLKDDQLLGEILADVPDDHFPGSRGVKHAVKSRCVLSGLLLVNGTYLRLLSTHFTVSDFCTETTQMFELAQFIQSFVSFSANVPLIFSADMNIRSESYSVKLLEKVMTLHTGQLEDTLSSQHRAKQKDFPHGLAVDHVFSQALKHKKTEAIEVDFSDHKAIVSTFEL